MRTLGVEYTRLRENTVGVGPTHGVKNTGTINVRIIKVGTSVAAEQ